jgi:tight adherence protein C
VLRRLAGPDGRARSRAGYTDWAVVTAVVAVVPLAAVAPALVILPPMAVATSRWWRARRRTTRWEAALVESLPDVADLLSLAVAGGSTSRGAVEAAARHGHGPLADAFGAILETVDRRGSRLADDLAALPSRLGPAVEPLVHPLVAAERYGTPLGTPLGLAGRDLRQARRHRAEEAIRRVPVKLVFPLVCCTLPAFGVLTVVPLLAASIRQIEL